MMGYVVAGNRLMRRRCSTVSRHTSTGTGSQEPVLLVVHQDLFRNGNSFVFGLARQQVGAAVVSTARLGNEYYGRQSNDDDLIDRITKEGAHEIGHLLGLAHCENRECIMFRPDTLDELDRKKKMLCPDCRERLDGNTCSPLNEPIFPVS